MDVLSCRGLQINKVAVLMIGSELIKTVRNAGYSLVVPVKEL